VLLIAGGYTFYLTRTRDVPARGGTVREGLVVDGALSLLPPFAQTQNSRDVSSLLFRGLTRNGPDGRAEGELALSWEVDAQSQTYTFHMRPHLRWSDGSPLTAADAVYTLSLLQSPALAQTATGQAWSGVTATAPDANTVVYKLSGPSGSFATLASSGLLPQRALKDRNAATLAPSTDVPTSGPFMVGTVERDRIHLVRNPYALEPAWLDGIELRLYFTVDSALQDLLGGDVDILAGLSPADGVKLTRSPNRTLRSADSFDYIELLFNQKQAALSDQVVRRAIAQSVNRGGLINDVYRGHADPLDSPVPPGIWAAAPLHQPAYDPIAARKALDQDGWATAPGGAPRHKSGANLSLRLAAVDAPVDRQLAERIKSDLARVGIGVTLKFNSLDKLVQQLAAGSFDMALNAVRNGPDPDVYVFWHSSEEKPDGFNFSGMARDVFLDKDLEDTRFKAGIKTRRDAILDAQRILLGIQPAVFLCSPDVLIGINNRVHGYRLFPAIESSGRFEFAQDWFVNTRRVGR
jgi:peptide/nickel transport system substrate-binding protein